MSNYSNNNQSFENLIKQIEEIPLPNIRRQSENAKRNYPKIHRRIMNTRTHDKLAEVLDDILKNGSFEEKVALKRILNGINFKDKSVHGLVGIVKRNLNRQTETYTNKSRTKSPKKFRKSRKSRKTRKNRK